MNCEETEEHETKEEKKPNPAIILRFKKSSFLKQFGCSVCPSSYTQTTHLKYHIRREHFNLMKKITKREKREVNDAWLERVVNSRDIIEIKKTGHNKYVMKKSSNLDCVEILESTETIDLTPLYPDCARPRSSKIQCGICNKLLLRQEYMGHLEEEHADAMM